MFLRSLLAAFALLAASLTLSGCNPPSGADDAVTNGAALILAEEPDGAQTVLDVRHALLGEPEQHDHEHDHGDDDADHDHDADQDGEHDHGQADADDDHGHDHAVEGFGEEVGDDDVDDQEQAAEEDHGHDHGDEDAHDHAGEDADHDHEHPAADHDHDFAAEEEHPHDHDHEAAEHADDHGGAADAEHEPGDTAALDVVMVGVVGGVTNPFSQAQPDFPFVQGEATLFLADPSYVAEAQSEGHQHAPGEECAFCEAHADSAADAVVMVRFVDDAGQPIKTDARELLGLEAGQTVVVSGSASVQPGNVVIVDALGIYVRQ